jgi:hypothetical protein
MRGLELELAALRREHRLEMGFLRNRPRLSAAHDGR